MIRNIKDFKRSGQSRGRAVAAVEMAIMTPLLILIFSGIITFGLLFFLHNNMINAAREAARGLAVGELTVGGSTSCDPSPTAGSAEAVVCGQLSGWPGLSFTLAACNPAVPGPNCVEPLDVAVEITIPLSEAVMMDLFGYFADGVLKLKALVIMREE
ncbi:MAG: TadE family protein [Candidatus Neomarinimicrobiota bacterium]